MTTLHYHVDLALCCRCSRCWKRAVLRLFSSCSLDVFSPPPVFCQIYVRQRCFPFKTSHALLEPALICAVDGLPTCATSSVLVNHMLPTLPAVHILLSSAPAQIRHPVVLQMYSRLDHLPSRRLCPPCEDHRCGVPRH